MTFTLEKFQLTIPTRKTENWKYTPIQKLLDAEFCVGHVGATGWSPSERPVVDQTGRPTGSPYKRPMQLSMHPFANLAIAVANEIKTIEIKEPSPSLIKINLVNKEKTAIHIHQRIHVAENIQAEILFDHASHGATVGQLDQQALFYLQARGIALEEAKSLLIEGFLAEVLSNIENKN